MLGRSLLLKVRRPQPVYPDYVQEYINRVIAADVAAGNNNGLEDEVTDAISTCLQALVADGILGVSGGALSQSASLIKAGCFMMGARTLSGALVPLAPDMPAPTNFNFVAGDYNRRTGLGSTTNVSKYLNTNRSNNADPQNSKHIAVYVTAAATGNTTQVFIGSDTTSQAGVSLIYKDGQADAGNEKLVYHINQNANTNPMPAANTGYSVGLIGASRSDSTGISGRLASVTTAYTQASETPDAKNIGVFARTPGAPARFSNARLNFYSVGESLDLAILDARITALSNAIQAAIAL